MDGIYLSKDERYDSSDTPLIFVDPGIKLSAGTSYTRSVEVTLPGPPPGSYYLIVRADSGDALTELDETNNVAVLPLQVTRELSLLAAPDTMSVNVQEGATVDCPVVKLTNMAEREA
jgi:hypothetical protein